MSLPLFEEEIPSRFKDYHYRIRGWKVDAARPRDYFNDFIGKIDPNLHLETEKIDFDGNVAYVCWSLR